MPRCPNEKKRDTGRSPVSDLSDDLLVEIISRVPYKATRRCKCICRRWRDLVAHPDHRMKLPQSTLAGFFYETYDRNGKRYCRHYQSVSGSWCPCVDPNLSFLQWPHVDLLDSCNGLLLCRRCNGKGTGSEILDYVVCNPATEKWVAVPTNKWSDEVWDARLGFDPAASSHFHVFELVRTCVWDADKKGDNNTPLSKPRYWKERVNAVGVYSSESGAWTHQSTWEHPLDIRRVLGGAFLNGAMYLSSDGDLVVAVVDVEGRCRAIPIPTPHDSVAGFDVYQSRGQLHLANYGDSELSVWVLEDFSTGTWTLKHNVSHLQLFGEEFGEEYSSFVLNYEVIIHPEYNVIFLLWSHWSRTTLMSYEMDSKEPRFICDLSWGSTISYRQYVPFFSESLADGH